MVILDMRLVGCEYEEADVVAVRREFTLGRGAEGDRQGFDGGRRRARSHDGRLFRGRHLRGLRA